MEGGSSIFFILDCRGIRLICFEQIRLKLTSFPFKPLCFPLAIYNRYAKPFSKKCSNCSVTQSVWLYNILVLVHYHTSVQKRVNCLKVKVTMTQKRSIFARAVSLQLCNDYASYFIFKRLAGKGSQILILESKGQRSTFLQLSRCTLFLTCTPLNHRCINLGNR